MSNTFSNSDSFTKSNIFRETILVNSGLYSLTLTHSLYIIRTLTVINSFLSNTLSFTLISASHTFIFTEIIYYEYTIYQYSSYYSYYYNFFDAIIQTESQNSNISKSVFVGITCGSVIILLLIIGIIIFITRRSKKQISSQSSNKNDEFSSSDGKGKTEFIDKEFNNTLNNENDQWI